ncbi:hypothetical protein ACFPN2_34575 [Steroidobacter flavus]|uniref:Uncharacterized protein n=1 Tax=Steroidobacter flavus TaxID=1842136 RepID=A0ABV8T2Q7_9GAMM
MKGLIACLILLSAGVSTQALAIVLPVYLDTGVVTDSPGSGTYCGVTNAQLPGGLTQTSTVFATGGNVSFGTNAYSYALTSDYTAVCTTVFWNVASYGTFSGWERVMIGGYLVTIDVTGNYQYGNWSGAIFPKYQVLGVDYAPPGASSSVSYSANFVRGTSQTIGSSFKDQTQVSLSTHGEFEIGKVGVGLNTNITSLYSQQTDYNSTDSWSVTTTGGDIIRGPASSAAGVDHDYDIVWIWLNPAINLILTGPASITWNGYSYNTADPVNEMDVLFLYVYELKDPSRIPANVASRLARSWDQSGVGGLNATDYATILASTPFGANPAYDPNTDTSGRYTLQIGQTFNYIPAPPGGQPVTQTFSTTTQSTSTSGSGSEITRSVSTSIENKLGFKSKAEIALKLTDTVTTVSKQSSSQTTTAGQTASFSITGPQASDNYTGPTAIQIWRDNIYGSYMFYAAH